MRQRTYLNAVLTVNAVLLAGLLWTKVAERPLLATEAGAQSRTRHSEAPTIPNAAKQRAEVISALQDIQRSLDTTQRLLQGGNVKVEVTNLHEISLETN